MSEAEVWPSITGNTKSPMMPLAIMPAYTRSFRSSLASMLPTPALPPTIHELHPLRWRVAGRHRWKSCWIFPGLGPKWHSPEESEAPEDAVLRNDLDPLILDLLEWIGREPRCYADVIDAWRASCPRLTVCGGRDGPRVCGARARQGKRGDDPADRGGTKLFARAWKNQRAVRSPDGAQRNPGPSFTELGIPDCAALHPGYETLSARRTPCARRSGPAAAGSSCGRRSCRHPPPSRCR